MSKPHWKGGSSWHNIQPGCFSDTAGNVWYNRDTDGSTHDSYSRLCQVFPDKDAGPCVVYTSCDSVGTNQVATPALSIIGNDLSRFETCVYPVVTPNPTPVPTPMPT